MSTSNSRGSRCRIASILGDLPLQRAQHRPHLGPGRVRLHPDPLGDLGMPRGSRSPQVGELMGVSTAGCLTG
jgi:hypothetical protein